MCKGFAVLLSICVLAFNHARPSTADAQVASDDTGADWDALRSELEGLSIDVNTASSDRLAEVPLFRADEVQRILEHRDRRGPFHDIDALADAIDLTADEAEMLRPYLLFGRQRRPIRLRMQARASTSGSRTSDARILTRSLVEGQTFSAALVTERDPGEASFLDHAGGYLKVRLSRGTHLWAGDLRPGIGLGAVYARSTRASVSSAPTGIRKSANWGTVSSNESGALRGIAVTTSSETGSLGLVYGLSRWDASIRDDTAVIRHSGDHVSESARAAAGSLTEKTYLLSADLGSSDRLGIALSRSTFDHVLDLGSVTGRVHDHFSTYGTIGTRNRLFGEFAVARIGGRGGHAAVVGAVITRGTLRVTGVARSLSPRYSAVRSASPVAYGGNNERGLTLTGRFRYRRLRLNGLVDRHQSVIRPNGWPGMRRGTRTTLTGSLKLARAFSGDIRVSGLGESRSAPGSPPRTSRALRIRLKAKSRIAAMGVWAETARGKDGERGQAAAIGTDLSLGPRHTRFDVWLACSRRSGRGARVYGYRPEVWGGRSVLLLPAHGVSASARFTLDRGPLSLSTTYHHLPSRRGAVQISLTR